MINNSKVKLMTKLASVKSWNTKDEWLILSGRLEAERVSWFFLHILVYSKKLKVCCWKMFYRVKNRRKI